MIRINLLGVPRPKKGKRSSAASAGEGMSPLMTAAAIALITVGALGGWWWKLAADKQDLAEKIATADRNIKRLAQVKTTFEARKREAELYERRVQIIDALRSAQSGPVDLLTMIGDTVSATDAVWLNTMKEKGSTLEIEGMALSTQAVANLMANLQQTKQFKSVEIKETSQDPSIREMQAFVFTLTCEWVSKT